MPASIFDLGIGPIINASWVLSGLMLFKPLRLATQIKELQRNGREVRSKPQRIYDGGTLLVNEGRTCRLASC